MAITEESNGIDGRRFYYIYDTESLVNEVWEYYLNNTSHP